MIFSVNKLYDFIFSKWFHWYKLIFVLHWVMTLFKDCFWFVMWSTFSYLQNKDVPPIKYCFHKYDDNDYLVIYRFSVAKSVFVFLTVEWRIWWSLVCNQVSNQLLKICLRFHAQIMDTYCCSPHSNLGAKILIHSYTKVNVRTLFRNNHLYADS